MSEDRHVLRDEIFPLNVLYNVHLSATEFRKAYNFEETSEDFTYGASRTAQAPGREIYVYVIGRSLACDELAAVRLRPRDESPPFAGR